MGPQDACIEPAKWENSTDPIKNNHSYNYKHGLSLAPPNILKVGRPLDDYRSNDGCLVNYLIMCVGV